jgi:16S rRNA (cytidine1402-2'-O)-methyltransferase
MKGSSDGADGRNRPAGGAGRGEKARTYVVDGHPIPAPALAPGLFLVATPIGNLGDVTIRALAVLSAADIVACEDTRVTSVLLRRFGIAAKLLAYHDHNAARQRPKLLEALDEGRSVALVSDAGTPLVSDPGYRLAAEARAAGHDVVAVPGASAVLTALVASGLPTDAFLVAGFLPPRTAARKKRLAELAAVPATLVFFESAQRVADSLADMAEVLGRDRGAAVARELTKAFEATRRGHLGARAAAYTGVPPPQGAIVVVVGPPGEKTVTADEADRLLMALLQDNAVGEAAAAAAATTGLPRRDLYQRALQLKDGR